MLDPRDQMPTTNAAINMLESTEMPIVAVVDERFNQEITWGQQDHSAVEWISVLTEEVGEAAMAANKLYWSRRADEYPDRVAALRAELVQVAAVAVAAIEALDRADAAKQDGS